MDVPCLFVIDVTSFWQTLWRKRDRLVHLAQVPSSSKLRHFKFIHCLTDRSYLQNLLCHLHYHQLLWLSCQSPFGSYARPSVWPWQTSAPQLWSPRRHPRRTDRQEKNRNEVCKRERKKYDEHLILTSLKASLSSFTPIIPAVSSKSFGVMRSTKSSKSTLPPTGANKQKKTKKVKLHLSPRSVHFWQLQHSDVDWRLTVHVDVLTQLNQLHLCGHVTHRSHEITQVLTADQPVLVLVKFIEGITQLCGKTGFNQSSGCQNQDFVLLDMWNTQNNCCVWELLCSKELLNMDKVWQTAGGKGEYVKNLTHHRSHHLPAVFAAHTEKRNRFWGSVACKNIN